jgi:S1-C subfamily serine protease
VLSALSRRVEFDDDTALFGMLQTDAPITNGSSGGALVDEEGRLIGITSAIGVSQAGAEGIGYAIPVDLVRRVTDELIATGTVHHAFLGILGGDYIETGTDGALIPAGAQIIDVDPVDGAAGRAGLLTDDVIVGMEGVEIKTMNELVIQLRLHRVGETIDVRILRADTELTVPVTLDERPDGV